MYVVSKLYKSLLFDYSIVNYQLPLLIGVWVLPKEGKFLPCPFFVLNSLAHFPFQVYNVVQVVAQIGGLTGCLQWSIVSEVNSSISTHILSVAFATIDFESIVSWAVFHMFEQFVQTSWFCRKQNCVICIKKIPYQTKNQVCVELTTWFKSILELDIMVDTRHNH